ncbi:MAG: DUF2911 domain-containing protein [Thermoanaerobaculia bacterium]|nr:DUF2911 domain-containing protein [Thermoanaerobaculia bacterium]
MSIVSVASRLVGAALVSSLCLASMPLAAQIPDRAVRRAGDVRDGEADAKRQRALSRLLLLRTRSLATLELEGGEVMAHWGKLETSHADYAALESLGPGEVSVSTGAAALKLRNEVDLIFGGVAVPAGNHAEGFAGTYSLWLKRTADGWSLVVNDEADVWGTQRDPAQDVAEVPVRYESTAESASEQALALEASDGGGVLVLSWGPHRWSAPFKAGSPS